MNKNTFHNFPQANKIFQKTLLVSAILGALSATSLQAQESDTNDADDGGIERIFVTASKRQTGLQQTPIAVTVTSGETIEQAKVLDIGDLQVLVPTLRVTPLQRSTNTNFAIRGFGNGTNNTGIEPSVGIFIDGVYRSRAAAQIGDLPRLQQVEVLSGPQSTLFGKNASAGVISVRTEAPSYDFEGKVEAGIGNYNQRQLRGYISNGITDELAFSLSGGINTRDGYTDSLVGLDKINDRDRWNLRGQMLYEPMEDVKFRLIADYSEIDEICCTTAGFENGPTALAIQALGGIVTDDADPFSFESALNASPHDTVEDGGISLQADIDFDDFAFTSITAFRNNESDYINDVDFTSLDILRETAATKIETFTQEFRLTSNGDNKLDWMIGGFYFDEKVTTGDDLIYGDLVRTYFDVLLSFDPATAGILGTLEGLFPALNEGDIFKANTSIVTDFTQQNDAYSFFVNLDYHLTEDFTATLGVSYTKDEKEITVKQQNNDLLSQVDFDADLTVFGATLVQVGFPAAAIGGLKALQFQPQMLELPNPVEANTSDDDKITWSLRGAYTLNKNVNFFATAATGFKATSWNLSRDTRPFASDATAIAANSSLVLPNQGYGTRFASPEKATVYELGIKTSFRNGAFSATIFNQTIEGFQSSIFVGTGFVLSNAGEQNTVGIEFDSIYRPTDNISLTFAGTLLDPEYVSFVNGTDENGPADLSGTTVPGVHEQSIVAGITYDLEFDNGIYGYLRTDYIYESDVRVVGNIPDTVRREVSTFNASAGLNFENGLMLQVYVRNLNNDEYFLTSFPRPIQTGSIQVYPNQPRTFGASIAYEF
ncbi:TonB-dependent receptor [Paraglaciecola psychrophila]|jgi:iron complex outermembrane receptor protein|uniref:TonB-dependent receptor n=1 Tax=Paraglaciecola psychrophila 170 TaxID=1129794 RepID=K7AAF4_9ALTE|nr:TonB-dependent receptor [Paraglaciecola psychrophila]AGH46037.1 TonB-dependent receptor [Paraglaciecola psychrophila 170]GAC37713.1 TonB-dependent receptor [Paraglaciecola psychrophila 170]